jgi:hypothetical protein
MAEALPNIREKEFVMSRSDHSQQAELQKPSKIMKSQRELLLIPNELK